MLTSKTRPTLIAIVLAVTLVLAACGGESTPDVSDELPPVESLPELEFGRGELPITVPSNWPMPQEHKIAGTMIDGTRALTEVVFTANGAVLSVVASYERALPEAGYTYETTKNSDNKYTIEYEGNGIEGDLVLQAASSGVTAATMTFVYS